MRERLFGHVTFRNYTISSDTTDRRIDSYTAHTVQHITKERERRHVFEKGHCSALQVVAIEEPGKISAERNIHLPGRWFT
jgi:hypothetical protein